MSFENFDLPPRNAARGIRSGTAALVALAALVLAGCASSGPSGTARADEGSPTASPPPTPPATEAFSPTPVIPTVTLECRDASFSVSRAFTISIPSSGTPDFSEVWAQSQVDCDAARSTDPLTPVEAAAVAAAKSGDTIDELYAICAVVDPDDVYAETDFTPSEDQVTEISAALVLCPAQPHAKAWRQSVARGQTQIKLAAEGRTFADGVHLVGKEIKPGTYAIVGHIEDCYWERQNKSGEIIRNGFVLSAQRVQVTIKSTDYAFSSQGCGQWEPTS